MEKWGQMKLTYTKNSAKYSQRFVGIAKSLVFCVARLRKSRKSSYLNKNFTVYNNRSLPLGETSF